MTSSDAFAWPLTILDLQKPIGDYPWKRSIEPKIVNAISARPNTCLPKTFLILTCVPIPFCQQRSRNCHLGGGKAVGGWDEVVQIWTRVGGSRSLSSVESDFHAVSGTWSPPSTYSAAGDPLLLYAACGTPAYSTTKNESYPLVSATSSWTRLLGDEACKSSAFF